MELSLAAARRDWPRADSLASAYERDLGTSVQVLVAAGGARATVAAVRGEVDAAQAHMRRAAVLEHERGRPSSASKSGRGMATLAIAYGRPVPPADPWLESDTTNSALITRAYLAAASGDTTSARRLLMELRARRSTRLGFHGATPEFLEACIAARARRWESVVELVAQAAREGSDRGGLTIPGVRNCGSHIGQAMSADEPYGVYFTENWISVDPSVDYDATLARVQETVDGYPGLIRDVQTYLKERIREVLTGSSDTVVVRIYGPDLHTLQAKADEVRDALEGIEGIVDLKTELHADIPQVDVEVDLAAAQRHGIKPGDVRRASAFLLQGEEVGDIFQDGKTYDVNVWSTPETRSNPMNIGELLINTPKGGHVRRRWPTCESCRRRTSWNGKTSRARSTSRPM